jgi:hypothetical protein
MTPEVLWAEVESQARRQRLAAERRVDAVLADSFPASDPPSWTLGVTPSPREIDATSPADVTRGADDGAALERGATSETVRELARRIEAEYTEMPGLSVTLRQAQRLWAADRHTCQTVLARLIARGVLRMTRRGRFVRA